MLLKILIHKRYSNSATSVTQNYLKLVSQTLLKISFAQNFDPQKLLKINDPQTLLQIDHLLFLLLLSLLLLLLLLLLSLLLLLLLLL